MSLSNSQMEILHCKLNQITENISMQMEQIQLCDAASGSVKSKLK